MRIGRLAHDAITAAGSGRIVSVFARAANIQLDNGCLVTLLPPGRSMHPWAIAPVEGISFLTIGMEARIGAQVLTVGSLSVSLARARIAELRITSRPARRPSPTLLAMLEACAGDPHSDDSPQESAAYARIDDALHALSTFGDVTPLARLVGLGPGLTPSSDDVLLGVLAGLDSASESEPQALEVREELVRAIPEPLERRTSLISAQMLRAAVAHRYPEPVVELAHTLSRPNATGDAIRLAVSEVHAIGHHSGRDILRGFAASRFTSTTEVAARPTTVRTL